LARTTTIEIKLKVSLAQCESGRAAVDYNADAAAVRLAKSCDPKEGAG
jgi:ubiquitin